MRRRSDDTHLMPATPLAGGNSKRRPRRRRRLNRVLSIGAFFILIIWIIWPSSENKEKPTSLRRRAQQLRAHRSIAINPTPAIPKKTEPPKVSGGPLENEFQLLPVQKSSKWTANKRAYISILTNVGRKEVKYFREWIEYHILVAGVRRFWLILDECDGDERARMAAQPYIDAGIATAYSDQSCNVFGDEGQVSAVIERVYSTEIERATRWLAVLRLDEYLISPLRQSPVATRLSQISSNPFYESIDPNLINHDAEPVIRLSSVSFSTLIVAMDKNGTLTTPSFEESEKKPTFSVRGSAARKDRPLAKWRPSLNDVLASLDDSNALEEWGGVSLPFALFGDSGHMTPLNGVSVFATYTRRADPDRARNWRARSYTTLFNTDACELLRPDVPSSVHVCRKAKMGWSPKARTAIGDLVSPSHPIIAEDLRDKLYARGGPTYPYVARYTRSSSEWASSREDAASSPPHEFGHVFDEGVLQSVELSLETLSIALALTGYRPDTNPIVFDLLGELVRLLLGRNYLTRIARPGQWLVDALFRVSVPNANSTCASCDIIAAVGEDWERASLLFYDEATNDDIFELESGRSKDKKKSKQRGTKMKKKKGNRNDKKKAVEDQGRDAEENLAAPKNAIANDDLFS